METEKPKRQLSPEALEKLKYAREKALEAKRQSKLITKFEKEQKYDAKQKKREETYKAILELKKQKAQPEPQPQSEPEPEPEPESSSEEEPLPPPKPQKAKPKPLPPPPPKTVSKPRRYDKPQTEEKLYSNANVEILRQKLYEQTRRRLMSDLFSY